MGHRVGAVVLLALAIVAQAGAQSRRAVEVDDLFAMKRVANPRISPDGDWVAYTVSQTSLEDEKSETRIWMVPTAGGDAMAMTSEGYSASRPRWSADGKFLSFMASKGDGKTQVWTLNRLGGEAQQLTSVKQGISSHDCRPTERDCFSRFRIRKSTERKKTRGN